MKNLAGLLVAALLCFAQDYRGRVQGVVSDPTNAAIAQATVTLVNMNTKLRPHDHLHT